MTPIHTPPFLELTLGFTPASNPSYVADIPFEIICAIMVIATQVVVESGESWQHLISPMVLCQVCKSWRSYFQPRPEFWTSIILVPGETDSTRQELARLNSWLLRTQNNPIDIYCKFPHSDTFRDAILDILAPTSGRWRHVELWNFNLWLNAFLASVSEWQVKSGLPRARSGELLSSLRSLSLQMSDDPIHSFGILSLNNNSTLRTLRITNFKHRNYMSLIQHRLTRISEITLSQCYLHDAHPATIFQWYPFAKDMTLSYVTGKKTAPPPHIVHRSLKTLWIRGILNIESIFAPITLLALESLRIEMETHFVFATVLNDFMDRSKCSENLKYLTPREMTIQPALLSSLQSLITLHIVNLDGGSALDDEFFAAFSSSSYLPNLDIFWYEGHLRVKSMQSIGPLVKRTSSMNAHRIRDIRIRADQPRAPERDSSILQKIRSLAAQKAIYLIDLKENGWGF